MLCEAQVLEIYKLKISIMHNLSVCFKAGNAGQCIRGKNIPVARRYGVSPRAIRDIWNRKTWAYVTHQLWFMEKHFYDDCTELREFAPEQVSFFSLFLCRMNSNG